jgi:RimJ/RimL family protein N-acetyltransferase
MAPARIDSREAAMRSFETPRLRLRRFTRDDEAVHDVVYSDPEVCRFYCGRTRTLDEVREWLVYRSWQGSDEDLGFWAVIGKEHEGLLGLVALQAYVPHWIVWEDDPDARTNALEVELSYAFGRRFWGHGYATEAGRELIQFAFATLRIPRIAYGVDRANVRSVELMRRLGFELGRNLHPGGGNDVVGVLVNDRV